MRSLALLGAFVLLCAAYATFAAYSRSAAEFRGATDAGHVAAVKALLAQVQAPAGMTQDPYGTMCDQASASCWTSTTQQPADMVGALSAALASQGGKVRSHHCLEADPAGAQTPDGASGCEAVLDYRGSKITLTSSRSPIADNGGTWVRADSQGVTPSGDRFRSAALGAWASVDPLPAAWTAGATCVQPSADGCRTYQSSASVAMPLTQVCSSIRSGMRGQFFIGLDRDQPATASRPTSCTIVGHRYRSLGSKDGEYLDVVATSAGPAATTLRVDLIAGT